MFEVKPTTHSDLPCIRSVIDSTELFPSDLLDDMVSPFLNGNPNEELWLTASLDGSPIGVAYCIPEKLTQGTFNLLLIAIEKKYQGSGYGSRLVAVLEEQLSTKQGRILIVETSSLPLYQQTRSFYLRLGYRQEATIHDFYADGDGKVVFWKRLVRR